MNYRKVLFVKHKIELFKIIKNFEIINKVLIN